MATSEFDLATAIAKTPLFPDQWHLRNTGQTGGTAGADANIVDAWSIATGQGVVIGIVDDGVQYTHPDLDDNYNATLSYDFENEDSNPFPLFGNHGTSVAGIAVGEGDNSLGILGAAPHATFASLQLGSSLLDDYRALTYKAEAIDIYNNSWGPAEDFQTMSFLTQTALENGVTEGRGGLGSIYVFAGGNGNQEEENVNYNAYANSRYTIAVAAIDHNGEHSNYSTPGASLLISGYSNNDFVGITTTDNGTLLNSENYRDDFSGTSAAAPLVSGVIALMLEANPDLTWRDVQHILVETAELNDSNDFEWIPNGAGHYVNYKYGFGAIDATAAVNAALNWNTVGEEIAITSGEINPNRIIPDNNFLGVSSSFTVEENIAVEWVEIVFDAQHTWRGDLEIVLTSPDGTESVLAESRDDDADNYDQWVFTSARHWGESSQGNWTLTVSDRSSLISGTWNSWEINLYGTEYNPNSDPNITPPPTLNEPIYRFQNRNLPGTYLYARETEAENIRDNFNNFDEEGLAFQVSIEPGEELDPIYRFQSKTNPGTYLFVGEAERNNVQNNFADKFTEEGLAFYVYDAESDLGETIYRFQNSTQPGTYLFASGAERDNIIANFPNFIEEGAAFGVEV